jgi:hypothetical protein
MIFSRAWQRFLNRCGFYHKRPQPILDDCSNHGVDKERIPRRSFAFSSLRPFAIAPELCFAVTSAKITVCKGRYGGSILRADLILDPSPFCSPISSTQRSRNLVSPIRSISRKTRVGYRSHLEQCHTLGRSPTRQTARKSDN